MAVCFPPPPFQVGQSLGAARPLVSTSSRPPRVLVALPGLPFPLCHPLPGRAPLATVVLLKIPQGPQGPWRPRLPLGSTPLPGSRGQRAPPAPAAPGRMLARFFSLSPALSDSVEVQPLSTFRRTCSDLFYTLRF